MFEIPANPIRSIILYHLSQSGRWAAACTAEALQEVSNSPHFNHHMTRAYWLSQVLLWRRKLLSIAISNKVTLQGKSIRTSLGSIQHGCLTLIKFNPTLTRRKLAAPFLKGLLCLVVQTVQAWDGGSTLHPCGQAAGKASRSQQTSAILLSWLCYGKRMNAVAMSLELLFFLMGYFKMFLTSDRPSLGRRKKRRDSMQ